MAAIHTKTKEEFERVLKMIKRKTCNRVIFKDSWERFKENTCISWESGRRCVYCSYYSFCSRYTKDFFTIESFILYLNGKISRGLYYNESVILKTNENKKLARQCMNFRGFDCNNKDCINESCPLNKLYDTDFKPKTK